MTAFVNTLPSASAGKFTSFDGLNVNSRYRSTTQSERDRKISTAGELYAFEVLPRLFSKPGNQHSFSRSNWESNIRHYVIDYHPDYADMLQYGPTWPRARRFGQPRWPVYSRQTDPRMFIWTDVAKGATPRTAKMAGLFPAKHTPRY